MLQNTLQWARQPTAILIFPARNVSSAEVEKSKPEVSQMAFQSSLLLSLLPMVLPTWIMFCPYFIPKHAILSHLPKFAHTMQFSRSVVSDSLQPHGLQQARLPCPSPTPGAYSDSCPLSRGCHPTISSSVIPFSSCVQSFPALGSFPMSWLFTTGGQSIGASVSASVLPMNI